MAFFSRDQVDAMRFASLGKNVLISEKVSLYNPARISIGNNVRVEDFCGISAGNGGIDIGNYVHIAVYVSLIGAGKTSLADISGLSSRVAVSSSNDDYSGEHLTNPMVPAKYTGVHHVDVRIGLASFWIWSNSFLQTNPNSPLRGTSDG